MESLHSIDSLFAEIVSIELIRYIPLVRGDGQYGHHRDREHHGHRGQNKKGNTLYLLYRSKVSLALSHRNDAEYGIHCDLVGLLVLVRRIGMIGTKEQMVTMALIGWNHCFHPVL